MHRSIAALAVLSITSFVTAREVIPPTLQALAETERAFAKRAAVVGWRDSFLEFFADDAIALTPSATPAKERIKQQPSTPFSVAELLWEPRVGDVAASDDLGWLTGPSTSINHAAPDAPPRYGNYLSVWRKQPDGQWRVYIDVGVNMPELPSFAPGFTRMPLASRYAGKEGKAAATRALLDADKALNDRVASLGAGKAYADRLVPGSRLHRFGVPAVVGPEAIGSWLAANAEGMTAISTTAESSAAGDLGFSYGTFSVKGTPPQTGAYVRIWERDGAGKWLVVADVTQPMR